MAKKVVRSSIFIYIARVDSKEEGRQAGRQTDGHAMALLLSIVASQST